MWINVFVDLSLIISMVVIVSYVMKLLKQPLIIWYIIIWLLVSITGIVSPSWEMTTLSQMWVVILLFMVWLNLNPKIIKDVWKISLVTWLWQVIFTSIIWFWICYFLWFDNTTSIYIAIAITFSSTIVIMKLLSDKWDLNTLYWKISIWFLIVQDIVAMLILMFVSFSWWWWSTTEIIIQTLVKWVWLVWIIILLWIYVIPKVLKNIAQSQEFLELFSIWRCLLLASVFHISWFSIEIWALIAWVTLSMSPYRFEISSKMKSLRDFFIVMFFVLFGTHMTLNNIWIYITPIIILSFFILIWNPLIVMTLMWLLWYKKKTWFKAWLTVAQISEFSFILIILWNSVWHIDKNILSLISIIWLITIAWSTYFILYSDKLYSFLEPYLSIFEKKNIKEKESKKEKEYSIILFWYNHDDLELINTIKKMKKEYLVIDYNPKTISFLEKQWIPCMYWDAWDIELLEEIPTKNTKMMISSSKEIETNMVILEKYKNKKNIIITRAETINDTIKMYEAWSDYVLCSKTIWLSYISSLISEFKFDNKKFKNQKSKHIQKIQNKI